MHVKEIYVIFIHLFDSGIIVDHWFKQEKRRGGLFVNFTVKEICYIYLFVWFWNDLNKKKGEGGDFICEFYS